MANQQTKPHTLLERIDTFWNGPHQDVPTRIRQHIAHVKTTRMTHGPPSSTKHTVIGLDGSHAAALFQLTLLERIETQFPGFLGATSLFCGTQLSAVVAVMLAQGYPVFAAKDVVRTILEHHPAVSGVVGALTSPMYTGEHLRVLLDELFGDATLGDLGRHVAVDALQADTHVTDASQPRTHHAVLFASYRPRFADVRLSDVCMRAAALPGYFPPYQGYLSGYLVDNSPVVLCLPGLLTELGWDADDVACLAVSEGSCAPRCYPPERYGCGGYATWLPEMFNVFALSRKDYAQKACATLLGDGYHALDPLVPDGIDSGDVEALEGVARTCDLTGTFEWIERRWG